jgi:hypothetical protein
VAVTADSGGRFCPFDGVSEWGKELERSGGVGEDEGAMGRWFQSLEGEGDDAVPVQRRRGVAVRGRRNT